MNNIQAILPPGARTSQCSKRTEIDLRRANQYSSVKLIMCPGCNGNTRIYNHEMRVIECPFCASVGFIDEQDQEEVLNAITGGATSDLNVKVDETSRPALPQESGKIKPKLERQKQLHAEIESALVKPVKVSELPLSSAPPRTLTESIERKQRERQPGESIPREPGERLKPRGKHVRNSKKTESKKCE